RVWGKDYAGNISGPIEIAFSIKPPPWRSWWAFLLYFAAIIGIVFSSQRYRLRLLEERNRMLEAKIAERTSELADALHQVKSTQIETEKKNEELSVALKEVKLKNEELIESHQRADRIFSALAEALPGKVLDEKYLLDGKIGSGGFGAVYRGTHLILKRP